jgi:hyperosmotically inducible periplasmic protein
MVRPRFISVLALGAMLTASAAAFASPVKSDAQLQAAVTKTLQGKSEFRSVEYQVQDGVVTLNGTVDSYKQKLDLEKRVRSQDPAELRDEVEVTASAPDEQIARQLGTKLAYDRSGYGSVFNYLTGTVKDGVVTLGGEVREPIDAQSAVAIAESIKGVKGVVSHINVAPASIFDDQLRVRLVRAIYGDSVLSGFALNPAAPIRIVVNNGHVSLYGHVDTTLERQLAGMRANSVFGAFSVENHLTTDNDVER